MHNSDGSQKPETGGLLDQPIMMDDDLKTYGWLYNIAYTLERDEYEKELNAGRNRGS